jgi:hypothetical protein
MSWLQGLVQEYRKQEGLFDLFGVVLYSDEHAHVKKILRDDDYWSSFDALSGDNFAIFSVRPKKGYMSWPETRPGEWAMMVPVWKEPRENLPLLSEFSIKSTKNLPLLVVFTQLESEIVKLEFQLDDSSQEKLYLSLKEAISVIRKTLDGISKENIRNTDGVFAAAAMSYNHHKTISAIKKGVNIYAWARSLLP